jgi:hypothetical protein
LSITALNPLTEISWWSIDREHSDTYLRWFKVIHRLRNVVNTTFHFVPLLNYPFYGTIIVCNNVLQILI